MRDQEMQAWYDEATDVVLEVAATSRTFNADDVWTRGLDEPPDGNLRRLGVVMRELRAVGLLVRLGVDEKSHGRDLSHAQPVSRWRSA